ncbi:hypothetical protein ACKAV7_014252 [Fusarium commune]
MSIGSELLIPTTDHHPLDRKVPTGWDVEHNFKPLNPKTKRPDKAYDPAQHIYRTLTGEPLDTSSKFNVNLNSTWKHTTPEPARIPSLTSKDGVSYWNHYDLLGFILSLLQTDLDGATKDNFFLPLTAVYGRWCAKIGGDRKTPKPPKPPKDPAITAMADEQKGVGAVPTVFQCTWVADKGGVYFALGSSIAGYDWGNKTQVGKWQESLQRTRFDLLHGWNDIHTQLIEGKVWDFENSPNRTKKGKAGTHYGNCGETYPFLHIFHSWTIAIRENVNGLALKSFFLADTVLTDKYSPKEMHKEDPQRPGKALYIIPPCDNCESLVQVAKGTPDNFVYPPIPSTQ